MTAVPTFYDHADAFNLPGVMRCTPESYAMDFSRPDANAHGLHAAVLMASHEQWCNTMSYESTKKFASGKKGGAFSYASRFN